MSRDLFRRPALNSLLPVADRGAWGRVLLPAFLAGLCGAGAAAVAVEALAGSRGNTLILALLFAVLLVAFVLAGRALQQRSRALQRRFTERIRTEAAADALGAEEPDPAREEALAAALAAAPGAALGLAATSATWLLAWTAYLALANPLAAAAVALSAAVVVGWHERQRRAPAAGAAVPLAAYRQLIRKRDAARLNAARADDLRQDFFAACEASQGPMPSVVDTRLRGSLLTLAVVHLLVGGAVFGNQLPGGSATGADPTFVLLSVLLAAIPLLLLADALAAAAAAERGTAAWIERRIAVGPAAVPPAEPSPFVSIRLVGVIAAGAPPVGPIDVEIRAGEFVVLAGGSGGEATAVLRILAGLDPPAEGRVEVDGAALDAAGRAALRARTAALLPHSTPFERPLPARPTSDAEVAALLVALDLAPERFLADGRFRIEGATAGEAARLALAGAMLEGRPLLLVDHPALDRDAAWRARFAADWAQRLTARGTTVVMASRDPGPAVAADRYLRLEGGTIIDESAGGRTGR